MGGGAWPLLVGGVIRLVNSDNTRDSVLELGADISMSVTFLEGLRTTTNYRRKIFRKIFHKGCLIEQSKQSPLRLSKSRSVMP